MRILVIRTQYGQTSTGGIMLLDDTYFSFTLEDFVRTGPKVLAQTAIPAGRYKAILSMSNRFGKILPEILQVPGFHGIRIHGGNTALDTEGCILVARNRVGADTIQGSMSQALVDTLQHAGGEHEIEIINAWRKA